MTKQNIYVLLTWSVRYFLSLPACRVKRRRASGRKQKKTFPTTGESSCVVLERVERAGTKTEAIVFSKPDQPHP